MRPIPAEHTVACAINRAAGGRPVPGNEVHLLIDGPNTYRAMLEVIAGATRWVHFENYIIRSDAAGWRFAELLAARAREGISVRVLYDWFGSFGTRRGFWDYLRKAGVEVRRLSPAAAGGCRDQRIPQSPEAGRGRRLARRARRTVHRVRMDRRESRRRPAMAGHRGGHPGPGGSGAGPDALPASGSSPDRQVLAGARRRRGGASRAARTFGSSAASPAGSGPIG